VRSRSSVGRLVVAFVLTLLLGGCAAGATPTPSASPSPTAVPGPTAPPDPNATPTASPQVWGPAVLVTGWESCLVVPGPIATDPGGAGTHMRGGAAQCTDTANDPRVSGKATGGFEFDGWGTAADGSLVEWGTLGLENGGGSWEGGFSGIYTNETGDVYTVWYIGKGAYAGLTYFQSIHAPLGTLASGYPFQGLIYPGSPPKP
jgi:hypothetical protein